MKSVYALIGALVLSSQAHAAPVVTFTQGGSVVAGTIIQNFDGYADGASIGTNSFAHGGSSGSAVRPAFGSTGNFGSVHTDGLYSITFDPAHAFSFVLGSLDTYNTLTLSFADGSTESYIGSAITGGGQADGNQTSTATNGVVSFATTGPLITGASFQSSQDSFEFDNLAISTPEPATWALMIAGFGFVGAAMRRRTMVTSWAT
jgi:hypothetical protein